MTVSEDSEASPSQLPVVLGRDVHGLPSERPYGARRPVVARCGEGEAYFW